MNTISYELAKKLKEAGFPQGTGKYWRILYVKNFEHPELGFVIPGVGRLWEPSIQDGPNPHWVSEIKDAYYHWRAENYYIPTIEELIEELGDKLEIMRRGIFKGEDGWIVGDSGADIPPSNPYYWKIFSFGSTLLEALANLYIAIHEKK